MSLVSGNGSEVADVILDAYKRGFRIVFILGAALAALAFVFSALLMPQIEIKHEQKKVESDDSQSGSHVLDEKTEESVEPSRNEIRKD